MPQEFHFRAPKLTLLAVQPQVKSAKSLEQLPEQSQKLLERVSVDPEVVQIRLDPVPF
jgi:hypothetical protein